MAEKYSPHEYSLCAGPLMRSYFTWNKKTQNSPITDGNAQSIYHLTNFVFVKPIQLVLSKTRLLYLTMFHWLDKSHFTHDKASPVVFFS